MKTSRRVRHLNPGTAHERGLTLIEVLTALAIVGVVLVASMATIRYTIVARNQVDNWAVSERTGPMILDLITEDLQQAHYYNIDPDSLFKGQTKVLGSLHADSLDFITSRDAEAKSYGPADRKLLPSHVDYLEVGYRCRRSLQNSHLLEMWRRQDLGIDSEPFQGGDFELLADNVVAFDITYYKESGEYAEEFYEWPPDEETFGYPYRMKIRLTLEVSVKDVPGRPIPRQLTFVRNFVFPKEIQFASRRRVRPYIPDVGTAAGANTGGNDGAANDGQQGAPGQGGTAGFNGAAGGRGNRGAGAAADLLRNLQGARGNQGGGNVNFPIGGRGGNGGGGGGLQGLGGGRGGGGGGGR